MKDLKGCSHKWSLCAKELHSVCTFCGAIGAEDSIKDPLSQNGMVILKPGKEDWDSMPLEQKRVWHIRNKQRILADIAALGELKTRKKWDIPSGTFSQLMKRWGRREWAVLPSEKNREDGHLPPLPDFRDDWAAEVQLEWLKTYREALGAKV